MKNRDELIQDIENLPKFEQKSVASMSRENGFWIVDETKKVITEKNKKEILALVSNKYRLLQFEEVYSKILKEFDDLNGFIRYYHGKGVLVIYPKLDEFEIKEENFKGRIGLLITNSVDKSSAVNIMFVVNHGNYSILIPDKKRFRALHIENIERILAGYGSFVADIKMIWKTIVNKLRNRFLDEEEINNLFKNLRIGKKMRKEINEEIEDGNLWGLFIALVEKISRKDYKNKINQIEKLKKISQECCMFAAVEEI